VNLHTTNKDAYTPTLVSIGPFHHPADETNSSLDKFTEHKWRYMHSLLERTQNAIATLDSCGRAMLRFNINVPASYSELFDKLSDTKLAEIMLLDGCFILELFLRYSNSDLRLESDPIFTTSWMVLTLQRDLILLENQIPFFILDWLFTLAATQTTTGPSTPTLSDLALRFFRSSINHVVAEETLVIGGRRSSHHLLELYTGRFSPIPPPELSSSP
ncbi:UPF0481 protein At3g47200, partial [Linum perenne]